MSSKKVAVFCQRGQCEKCNDMMCTHKCHGMGNLSKHDLGIPPNAKERFISDL